MVSHSARAMRQATKIAAQQAQNKPTAADIRRDARLAYERCMIAPATRVEMQSLMLLINDGIRLAFAVGYIAAKTEEERDD